MAPGYGSELEHRSDGDGDGPTAHQAVWCSRTATFKTSYAAAGGDGGTAAASAHQGRTTALRRRLLLLRQPRPPQGLTANGSYVPHGAVGQYVQQDPDTEASPYSLHTWRPVQTSEQHYRNREAMLRQYQTWNGIDIKKMELPLYPDAQLHSRVSKIFRRSGVWMVEDQAARQLSQHARHRPPAISRGYPPELRSATFTGFGSLSRPLTRDRSDVFNSPMRYGQVQRVSDAEAGSGAAEAAAAVAEAAAEHRTRGSTPALPSRGDRGPIADGSVVATPRSPRPPSAAAAADGARGSAGPTKSVRFSDELTVHEPVRRAAAGLPRTRAMTAVLLSERLPVTASGGRVDYVDKLRKKSSRRFLQALDKVIARLKQAKLNGRGGGRTTAGADAAATEPQWAS